MKDWWTGRALAAAVCAFALAGVAGAAAAAPVTTFDSNVTSWDVGSGQSNGHFSVTADQTFNGGAIELGLRAEQRSVGAVTPTGNDYVVQAGTDPTNSSRAWWNFQLSIAFNDIDNNLASLDLFIRKDAGTNSGPALADFDLLSLRSTIDDRNAPHSDANFADIYQVSQNPVFGWFNPAYSLAADSTFAYFFTLTATSADSGDAISATMCVHTAGLACATVDEPPLSGALLGLGIATLALIRRRRFS